MKHQGNTKEVFDMTVPLAFHTYHHKDSEQSENTDGAAPRNILAQGMWTKYVKSKNGNSILLGKVSL